MLARMPVTPTARRRRKTVAARPTTAFRRVPLGSLRVFVAVAQHLSITRAADVLGVSASAVSMQIKALEDYLRVPLLRRDGRAVELTSEGACLLPRVERALGELEDAIDEVRAHRRTGELAVTTVPSFLQQWLLPRLPDFEKQHPEIALDLHTSDAVVDLRQSKIQAAVRLGKGNWPGLHVEKLLDEWLVPVCKPDLLERNGPVERVEDLRRYRLVHSTWWPWSVWVSSGADREHPLPGVTFDDSVTVLRAAESGQGLALGRWSLAAGDVAAGRLAVASRRAVQSEWAYYFVCRPDYLDVEKVAAFRRWIVRHAAEFRLPRGLKIS
jgi:LysR family glycine cleavage system transcriptional activator